MSRLDSFIRRMSAQRDILNTTPRLIQALPGLIVEIGLGSGRTYDHLRELFPERRIVVFESVALGHRLDCVPQPDLVFGDVRETASRFSDGCAALVHVDIETGVAEIDRDLATWLPALVVRLIKPGGFAVSGCDLPDSRLVACPLGPSVEAGRYHLLRRS